uniref:ABC transporter ATP-binding protein n=1 Tax=Haloprofundus sp. MHR1 TaxID=2572921 RepID=UPI001F429068|nr:ABC transporter ATP-binding protein [Haloprofundus sp. MHR1]
MTAIRTEGLTKRYGSDVYAVNDLDLTVERGEVFGFLGPNGAGKSTTIDMLLDYVRPTSGSATVLGYDAQTETRHIHERIGILPDDYGLYDRLSGRKHIQYAIDLKRTDDDPDAVLERVGLTGEAIHRPVGGYSKGMTQRVVLGIALVGDPDLLILDEPSSGLDPNGVRQIRELVQRLADQGKTVFFSSHILSQVEAVCDRVAILNDGNLVAVDSIDGLRSALGTGSTLSLQVDRRPDSLRLDDFDGVSNVILEEGTVEVTVTDPVIKDDVIDRVREAGADVLDIVTREPSLEELFTAYTGTSTADAPQGDAVVSDMEERR